MEGEPLPHLTVEQTQVVKDYYISRMESAGRDVNVTEIFPPKVVQMMKLLPPGYNLTRLPKQVLKSVMKGELPDMKLLPKDLQRYIRDNIGELFNSFAADPNTNIKEIDVIEKLPYYERPTTKQFSPYELFDDSHRKGRSFSLSATGWRAEVVIPICVGAYALLTVLVVVFECLRLKRRYDGEEVAGRVLDIVETVATVKNHRVPRKFRPDATSTLRDDNSVALEPFTSVPEHM
ncbi:Protein EGG-6 [Aphelenchoides avenae]|nr:Protein EGG-6 [Aphelenchus avenae]